MTNAEEKSERRERFAAMCSGAAFARIDAITRDYARAISSAQDVKQELTPRVVMRLLRELAETAHACANALDVAEDCGEI